MCFLSINCCAQQEEKESPIEFTGYVEICYQKDFNKPADHIRPDFVYSYNRANEFNLNIGFLKAAYATKKVRANLAFMAGTYVNANLSDEPEGLKNYSGQKYLVNEKAVFVRRGRPVNYNKSISTSLAISF